MYKIICTTDPYHASRMSGFVLNEKRTRGIKVCREGLTLKEAQQELLEFFKDDAGRYFPNWGVAVQWHQGGDIYANPTRPDGTRSYTSDVLNFEIVSYGK